MKKLLLVLIMICNVMPANALPRMQNDLSYNTVYSYGYHDGKKDGREQTIKTVLGVGLIVTAGFIIYELGRESRWATNEKGVVYRF